MVTPFRIGTRGSPLALVQARLVADALRAAHGWDGDAIELIPITTSGDAIQDRPLAEVGGKALWTKELDSCLLDGRTDLSVHSMKDVETVRPNALAIAAMPEGARVGTSSPRRTAQLLSRRPDLQTAPIRGNVQTRLAKVARGDFDATLLAAAGLDRLGLDEGVPLDLLPAPAQGAIGVEILAERGDLRALLDAIDHRPTHQAVDAERAFLAALGGDCHSAVAALAEESVLRAEILSADGREVRSGEGAPEELARSLLEQASPALRAMFRR